MKESNLKVPSIIAVFILLSGVVVGTALIHNQQSVQLTASEEQLPSNIAISNVQHDSFTVSWTTDIPTVGYILWGEGNNPTTPAQAIGGGMSTTHMVKVKSLDPDTEYSFTISSGSMQYKNEGTPWAVKTGSDIGIPDQSQVISGTVENEEGQPVAKAIVMIGSKNMSPMTAMTTSTGNWVIPLNLARNLDNTDYADLADSQIEITVLDGNNGKSVAVANANVNTLLPPMTIGKTHDFTNISAANDLTPPSAQVSLPTEEVKGISDSNAVTLESVENGEVIFTAMPEFFGDGPPGGEIKITVHSDPVSGTAAVENDGSWSWSPGQLLENGLHNITLEWIDTQGIVHTLTRSFIVQAQEGEPSFESTPSGGTTTPSPTASATATPRPTTTPSPSPSPTATVKASPTATPKGGNLPEAGVITPTVLLGTAGFVTLSLGALLALKK